jgi:hypothetical protein
MRMNKDLSKRPNAATALAKVKQFEEAISEATLAKKYKKYETRGKKVKNLIIVIIRVTG